MKPIMGSETEFGLVPRTEFADRKILTFLDSVFYSRRKSERLGVGLGDVAKEANWWSENLERDDDEDRRSNEADRLRRLGISGEYLKNGARFYVDCHHPEYSTPECTNPWELVAHEKAGERIVENAVAGAMRSLGAKAILLKRNADYKGHSYACHENYLVSRRLFEQLLEAEGLASDGWTGWRSLGQAIWVMHRISMQFFAGSGMVLSGRNWPDCLVLSQRQPFIEYFSALGTTTSRSIVNTRDRPYADPERFARLHVICGDSNRADWSNILKYGTSSLLLAALEDFESVANASYFTVRNPVSSFRSLSGSRSLVETEGGTITALDAQKMILEFVGRWWRVDGQRRDGYEWTPNLLEMWEAALSMFERGDDKVYSLFDFYIKKRLFEERMMAAGCCSTKTLQSLEFAYHLVGENSLFSNMIEAGRVEVVVKEEDVARAFDVPPPTRAKIRSDFLRAFEGGLWNSWHIVCGEDKQGKTVRVLMPNPFSEEHTIELEINKEGVL